VRLAQRVVLAAASVNDFVSPQESMFNMSICNASSFAALTVLLIFAATPHTAAVSKGMVEGIDLETEAAEASATGTDEAEIAQDSRDSAGMQISATGDMQSMQSREPRSKEDPINNMERSASLSNDRPQADPRRGNSIMRRSYRDAASKMRISPLSRELLKFLGVLLSALMIICSIIGITTIVNAKNHIEDHPINGVTSFVERLELAEDGVPLKPKLQLQVKGCGIRAGIRGRDAPKMPSEEVFPMAVKSYYSKADTPVNVIKNILGVTQTASLQGLLLSMSDVQVDVIRLTGIDVVSECTGAEAIVHQFVGAGSVDGSVLEDWLDFRGYSMESVPTKGQGDQASQKLMIKAGPHSGGSVVRVVCYMNNLGFDCLLQLSETNTAPARA